MTSKKNKARHKAIRDKNPGGPMTDEEWNQFVVSRDKSMGFGHDDYIGKRMKLLSELTLFNENVLSLKVDENKTFYISNGDEVESSADLEEALARFRDACTFAIGGVINAIREEGGIDAINFEELIDEE